ncbi:hypothetical protein [Chitinophaga filiformis]|uniref:hypothetical protein n=1 Tax=Chitinophaga filiformis TaxID=104663 RepID=UPI000B7EEB11|nr:hypothetical protein [Chitinophaga filiformis]
MNTTIPLYLLLAYGISTPCFLVMAVFNSHLRKIRPRYLSTANIIAALAALLMIILLVIDLRNARRINADDSFYQYRSATILPIILFLSAACLLTLSRKLRRNVLFTLVLIAIYCICIFKDAVYVFFTGFSRDYLPSSWSYYYSAYDLYILIYAAVYLAICYFIAAKPVSRSRR